MQIVKADTPVTPTAVPFKDKTVRQKVWVVLPWVVFGGACILFVVGLIMHYADGLDDDMASELVLSKMLSEGKGFIITNQWYYSTEIRFLNTQLIFTPLFWLFKSWAMVRIVGTIILNGIMLLAFYFLLASLQRKTLYPCLATLLLLPLSFDQAYIINFGAYYIPHVAISFTLLGLTFYAVRAVSKRNFWLLTGGGGILSLLSAIGGFRQVVVLCIPLFLAAVIYWLSNWQDEHQKTALKLLTVASIGLGAALIGLGGNLILQNYFSFSNQGHLTWQNWTLNSLENVINSFLAALGWRTGNLWGWETGGNIIAIIVAGLLVVAVIDIIKHRKHYPEGVVILTWFTLSGIIVYSAVVTGVGMDYYAERFVFPLSIFVLPVIAFYFTQNWQWQVVSKKLTRFLKPTVGIVGLVLVMLNAVVISSQFYFNHNGDRNAVMRTVGEQLLAGGYVQGYYCGEKTFWSGGNALTELTNGQIETWNLYRGATSLDQVHTWLQATAHVTAYPTGKVFLLLADQKWSNPLCQKLAADANAVEHIFYRDDNFIVYVYNSVDELQTVLTAATTLNPVV